MGSGERKEQTVVMKKFLYARFFYFGESYYCRNLEADNRRCSYTTDRTGSYWRRLHFLAVQDNQRQATYLQGRLLQQIEYNTFWNNSTVKLDSRSAEMMASKKKIEVSSCPE